MGTEAFLVNPTDVITLQIQALQSSQPDEHLRGEFGQAVISKEQDAQCRLIGKRSCVKHQKNQLAQFVVQLFCN